MGKLSFVDFNLENDSEEVKLFAERFEVEDGVRDLQLAEVGETVTHDLDGLTHLVVLENNCNQPNHLHWHSLFTTTVL
jgi:hypothetical protein